MPLLYRGELCGTSTVPVSAQSNNTQRVEKVIADQKEYLGCKMRTTRSQIHPRDTTYRCKNCVWAPAFR